jgi:hypothetical protein
MSIFFTDQLWEDIVQISYMYHWGSAAVTGIIWLCLWRVKLLIWCVWLFCINWSASFIVVSGCHAKEPFECRENLLVWKRCVFHLNCGLWRVSFLMYVIVVSTEFRRRLDHIRLLWLLLLSMWMWCRRGNVFEDLLLVYWRRIGQHIKT